jgi:hypothetical protein
VSRRGGGATLNTTYVNFHQSDWAEWLALAEFAHNDNISASTKMSPFFADHGYHPWKGIEGRMESKSESAKEFADRMKKVRDEATAALEKAQKRMKKYYDAKRKPAPEFKIGDKVWLEATNIPQDRPTEKFSDLRLGPYEILEKVGASAYKLKVPGNGRRYPVYNEGLLSPYAEPPPHRRDPRPPPAIISGQEEWEVEEILKSRKRGKGHQYLIKWKGFPHSGNTWEPTSNITHAKKLLNEFNKKHNIHTRAIPIFKAGRWDYLIRRFKPTQESLPYPTCKLFNPETGQFTEVAKPLVNEDVDLNEGVMSQSDQLIPSPMPSKPVILLILDRILSMTMEPAPDHVD